MFISEAVAAGQMLPRYALLVDARQSGELWASSLVLPLTEVNMRIATLSSRHQKRNQGAKRRGKHEEGANETGWRLVSIGPYSGLGKQK